MYLCEIFISAYNYFAYMFGYEKYDNNMELKKLEDNNDKINYSKLVCPNNRNVFITLQEQIERLIGSNLDIIINSNFLENTKDDFTDSLETLKIEIMKLRANIIKNDNDYNVSEINLNELIDIIIEIQETIKNNMIIINNVINKKTIIEDDNLEDCINKLDRTINNTYHKSKELVKLKKGNINNDISLEGIESNIQEHIDYHKKSIFKKFICN